MNILPKKRWHVRTKENIARVRKDEAEAAEKEKQEQLRIDNANREARLNILKHKSKQRLFEAGVTDIKSQEETPPGTEHINLFADLDHAVETTNKEHDLDVKKTKEDYEKKIGYLTYLGQDTNEALKKKNWYEVLPGSSRHTENIKDTYEKLVLRDEYGKPKATVIDEKNGEIGWKSKQRYDPLTKFKKYCPDRVQVESNLTQKLEQPDHCKSPKHKHKNKKDKKIKSKKHKEERKEEKLRKMQNLRDLRLKREMQEKRKADLFLTSLNGSSTENETEKDNVKVKPKYNSQFNPELARQNYR